MSPESKQLLKIEALIGGVTNAFFNSVIAWLMLKGEPNRTWGGDTSFAVDIVATGFILPFIVALIVIPLQHNKLNNGKLSPLDLPEKSFLARFAERMPRGTFNCALIFGLLGALVIAPPTLLLLYATGVQEITPLNYAVLKGVWAGLMAALLVLPMLACAHRPTHSKPPHTLS